MTIGLSLSFTWADGDSASFWAIKTVHIDAADRAGYLTLVPFEDQTTSGFPLTPHWGVAKLVRCVGFQITPSNFPFVPGTDAVQKAYAFIIQQPSSPDTGNIDWTTATLVTYP